MTITERWEQGIQHDPRSEKIYRAIAEIDFRENSDYFCWKAGGDGDNGESLMYLLDVYFESVSSKAAEGPGGRASVTQFLVEQEAKVLAEIDRELGANFEVRDKGEYICPLKAYVAGIFNDLKKSAPAAPSERDLRNILTRLIEFLARPYQEGGQGMADSADSELSKLLRELRAAPSERGDLTQQRCLYCSKPDSQVYHEAKDCPYQPSIPSLSEERGRFEQNVLSDTELAGCDRRFSVGRNEDGNYLLDFVQRRWEGWQARAGLSSQEGK